jgi:hypothetical protein
MLYLFIDTYNVCVICVPLIYHVLLITIYLSMLNVPFPLALDVSHFVEESLNGHCCCAACA